jgi:hypothetical protein
MIVFLPLLFAIVGGVIWYVSVNPKWAYLGLVSFGCGLLAFLTTGGGGQVVSLLGK